MLILQYLIQIFTLSLEKVCDLRVVGEDVPIICVLNLLESWTQHDDMVISILDAVMGRFSIVNNLP